MRKKILALTIIIFIVFGCKSKKEFLDDLVDQRNKYDKFEDSYQDNIYKNKKLGLTIEFDPTWVIINKYEQFDKFQQDFAKYYSSINGEVLFLGYNDEKKMGIRCIVDKLNMDNADFLGKLKSMTRKDIENYKIKFLSEKETSLKNVEALMSVFETTINSVNIFVFDSVLFRSEDYNFKLDIWVNKTSYEDMKEYIFSIFQTIDFVFEEEEIILDPQKEKEKENTTDTTDKEK